jgi:hypothetical protein
MPHFTAKGNRLFSTRYKRLQILVALQRYPAGRPEACTTFHHQFKRSKNADFGWGRKRCLLGNIRVNRLTGLVPKNESTGIRCNLLKLAA